MGDEYRKSLAESFQDMELKLERLIIMGEQNNRDHHDINERLERVESSLNGNGKPGIKQRLASIGVEMNIYRVLMGLVISALIGLAIVGH